MNGLIPPALHPIFSSQLLSLQVNRLRKQVPQNAQTGLLVMTPWQELVAGGPKAHCSNLQVCLLLKRSLLAPALTENSSPPQEPLLLTKGDAPNTCAPLPY